MKNTIMNIPNTKEMINVSGDGYVNYPNQIITHCLHELKCHTITYKYVLLLCKLKKKLNMHFKTNLHVKEYDQIYFSSWLYLNFPINTTARYIFIYFMALRL